MQEGLKFTKFDFPGQTGQFSGKVRDLYYFGKKLAIVTTDRISAFDVVLPRTIPYKGQVLNQIAQHFLQATKKIVPNWVTDATDPNATIGHKCDPFPIEMVVRGYLAGHAWRLYKAGHRVVCGNKIPNGLHQNDPLPTPIITPTTKSIGGHDEDISKERIISEGIIDAHIYEQLEDYSHTLFRRGTEMALEKGLILVDTKYEFGIRNGKVYLIDELHTPDSSRYFYADTYEELQKNTQPQRQLSKEFVREWLMSNGFQGKDGQQIPAMTDKVVKTISERYIELFERITGHKFMPAKQENIAKRIENNILGVLSSK